MKKTLGLLLVLSLVFGAFALPAEAKKKKKKKVERIERVVEFTYTCPCTGLFQLGTLDPATNNLGGGGIPVGLEYYLTATVTDTSGMPVAVSFAQVNEEATPPGNETMGIMCGETDAPIEIRPGVQVNVFIELDPNCGVPVGGTLTVTLSNLP